MPRKSIKQKKSGRNIDAKKGLFGFTYPFKEFLNHFSAWGTVRNYKDVRLDYSKPQKRTLFVGDSNDFEAEMFRMMDYMNQLYKNPHERASKGSTLHSIMAYLSEHAKAFEKAGLVYLHEDPKEASSIKQSALKAIHQAIVGRKAKGFPNIKRVISLALKFQKEEEEAEKSKKKGD